MLDYIFAGLALGAIYAIASAGIVVTYVSAGVVNFAFGSIAFVIARFFYWLVAGVGWPAPLAAAVSVLVVAPALGMLLWALVFRNLRLQSQLIRIVVTIGLSVALPPVAFLVFGVDAIPQAPGLAPEPVAVVRFLGAALNANQLIIYGAVATVLVAGTVLLRFTTAGVQIRAMVDSEALSSLSGMNPARISAAVWAGSTALAGLAGILVAPTGGLSVGSMTTLMAAAFAAVVAARLSSLTTAVVVALAMGVTTGLVQWAVPPDSSLSAAILPSIPFAFVLVFLAVYVIRGGRATDHLLGGKLDRAIAPVTGQAGAQRTRTPGTGRRSRMLTAAAGVVLALAVPAVLDSYWLGLVAQGVGFGIVFLAFTVVTGEGGMIWLCVATFAGGGAVTAAQLATVRGWPLVPSVVAAAALVAVIGTAIALLTLRLGDTYVSLVTVSFGLLVESLVFSRDQFFNYGAGVSLTRPDIVSDDLPFTYAGIAVLAVLGLVVVNLRRSTSGLALSAQRASPTASRTLGISVVRSKVLASGLAAFIAGLGGVALALYSGTAQPENYTTFAGLVWLAVLVTIGVRSVAAAVIAGLMFAVLPGLFQTYLPASLGEIPPLLFGLGAVMIAANPDGVFAVHARQLRDALERRRRPEPVAVRAAGSAVDRLRPEVHR